MQNKLDNFIEMNNLENSVKILNNISNPFPYVIKSDLFILSSIFEGLPNVILEALTLNKFVISTDCSTGPSEILLNGKRWNISTNKRLQKFSKKNTLL